MNKTNDLDKTYLTGLNKFSFAFAGFGQNLIIGFVNSYILYFYTDIFLIGAAPAGILMLVARFWDAANDPIMGTIVDKTRSKWGKMRPYIIFSALPLALSTAALFIVPTGLGQTGRIVYAYITYILWGMVYTICDVPFWGLASAMTPNPKERISFISTSRLVHSIGGVLPMVIVPLSVGLFGDKKAYTYAGAAIGLFGGALFTLAFFGTEERSQSKDKSPTLRECLSYLKINKPLRYVVSANVLGFMRDIPVVAGMYIAVYVLGEQTLTFFGKSITLNGAALNTALVAGWGISGYIGMILTPKICEKINYKQIYYYFATIGALASLALFFLPKTFFSVFITLFICGLPYGVVANVNYSMIADSVDYVEWKTGRRTEGVTVSFQTLMNKTMTALQTSAVSLMLIIIGFAQPLEVAGELLPQAQSAKAIKGLIFLITLLPALGWLISIIPMRHYSFVGEERQRAHREIIERRARLGQSSESEEGEAL